MSSEPLSFERDVKPLFREGDRSSMSFMFDLWSHADVSAHAPGILAAVENGSMPCDGRWDSDKVDTFRRWVEEGKAA